MCRGNNQQSNRMRLITTRISVALLLVVALLSNSLASAEQTSLRGQIMERLESALNSGIFQDEEGAKPLNNTLQTSGLPLIANVSGPELIDDSNRNLTGGVDSLLQLESEVDLDEQDISNDFAKLSSEDGSERETTLMQITSTTEMSFNCWSQTQETCESKDCVWHDDKCTVSASAIGLVCNFYCEASICIPTLPATPPDVACPPKPSSLAGLCSATTTAVNCKAQAPFCSWNGKTCQDAPSCCTRAISYCKKPRRSQLNNVLGLCEGLATKATLCSFAQDACT
jgi:hypothetical protein